MGVRFPHGLLNMVNKFDVTPFWTPDVHHRGDAVYWHILTEAEANSRIQQPGWLKKVLPHEEWYFQAILAIIKQIDFDAYPATREWPQFRIVDPEYAKQVLSHFVYFLLVIRHYYKTKKEYQKSDAIRARLGELGIEVKDEVQEGPSLIKPVWGRFVSWEFPPFQYSHYWKKSAADIWREKQPPEFEEGGGI